MSGLLSFVTSFGGIIATPDKYSTIVQVQVCCGVINAKDETDVLLEHRCAANCAVDMRPRQCVWSATIQASIFGVFCGRAGHAFW